MRHVLVLILLCPGLFAQDMASKVDGAQKPILFDTDGTKLQGTLTTKMFYGPPGFGETPKRDVRDRVLVVRLAAPITVHAIEDAKSRNSANLGSVSDVREVQLFFGTQSRVSEAQARKLVGKVVVVVGTLDEAIAHRQYTKVTMDVKDLSPK